MSKINEGIRERITGVWKARQPSYITIGAPEMKKLKGILQVDESWKVCWHYRFYDGTVEDIIIQTEKYEQDGRTSESVLIEDIINRYYIKYLKDRDFGMIGPYYYWYNESHPNFGRVIQFSDKHPDVTTCSQAVPIEDNCYTFHR